MSVKHYSYRVIWSEKDQEYVGLCVEFPSLSWLEEEQANALAGIVRLVGESVKDMLKNGEPIPEPLSKKNFSGKISLRTTPDIHRTLAMNAAEHGVSLNRHINALISNQKAEPTL